MSNELYQYTTPVDSSVQITLDNGLVIVGVRGTYQGRDGYCCQIPTTVTTTMGSRLLVSHPSRLPFNNRGLLIPSTTGPALFCLDDVTLEEIPVTPGPTPPTPPTGTPQEIINAVYNTGQFNLGTKEGCGTFTEACCDALHATDPMWGHIAKSAGQNQFNGHAVDALMLLTGPGAGIWDIIFDSEGPNAMPNYIYKGAPENALWYYPAAARRTAQAEHDTVKHR